VDVADSALTGQPQQSAAALLRAAADRFMARAGHWTPARWARPAGAVTRADLVYELVQRLADLAADAEHHEHRRVPRLDNDLALPDQLRVMVLDLLEAHPPAPVLAEATVAVATVTNAL
jgi:hypothetical protein